MEDYSKERPIISIIVPVYNVEKYLPVCVESILNQTFVNYECILVDDGSSDECSVLCDEYAKQDIRISVIHQANSGVSAARNVALKVSRGDYIAFIDSDDYIATDYLEKLYRAVIDTKADISICDACIFTNDVKVTEMHTEYNEMSGKEALLFRYRGGINIAPWGKLISSKLLDGIYFPVGKIHEDQAVIPLILYRADKVCIINEQLYFYRKRSGSITNEKFSERHFDNIEFMEEFINYLNEQKETKLAIEAKRYKEYSLALYTVWAKNVGIELPKKWQMTELKILRILRKKCPDDKYVYYLSVIHPQWVKYHKYVRKIKSVFVGKK